jgi:transcriptional regulator with XRE-family HTH domain
VHDDEMPAQPVPYAKVLADNARAARARAKLTQQAVARKMRVLGCRWHFQTVGNVERGDRPLSAHEVIALAIVLDTAPEVLILPPPDVPFVTFGEQVIPSQRVAGPDDSVTWDGDTIKVTAPTEVYRPIDQRRAAIAAMEAALEKIRQVEAGEATWAPPHPDDLGAADIRPRRPGEPPSEPLEWTSNREEDHGEDPDS